MERLWGLLLATPLRPYQVEALNIFSQEHVQFSSEKILNKTMLGMKVKPTIEEDVEDYDYNYQRNNHGVERS